MIRDNRNRQEAGNTLERIGYAPPASYAFDIEVMAMRDLRTRAPAADLRKPHRIEFHELIFVTRGECTHVVDFEPIHCRPGSVLALQPSQVEQFDVETPWDGWLVLFRPEQLFASQDKMRKLGLVQAVAELPVQITLDGAEARVLQQSVAQMHLDGRLQAHKPEAQALLLHQLCTVLLRLVLAHRQQLGDGKARPSELDRFRRFRLLVDQSFARWHSLAPYADAIGCTSRTLTRVTLNVAGVSAKAFVANRITLEAKRLLAHTGMPVAGIGDELGFDDSSNFTKFFRREAGCTPIEFRAAYRQDSRA
jgi:AraC-like DNA-binding protein